MLIVTDYVYHVQLAVDLALTVPPARLVCLATIYPLIQHAYNVLLPVSRVLERMNVKTAAMDTI